MHNDFAGMGGLGAYVTVSDAPQQAEIHEKLDTLKASLKSLEGTLTTLLNNLTEVIPRVNVMESEARSAVNRLAL